MSHTSLRLPFVLSVLALVGGLLHEPIRLYLGESAVSVTTYAEFGLAMGAIYFAGNREQFFISRRNIINSFLFSAPLLALEIL